MPVLVFGRIAWPPTSVRALPRPGAAGRRWPSYQAQAAILKATTCGCGEASTKRDPYSYQTY